MVVSCRWLGSGLSCIRASAILGLSLLLSASLVGCAKPSRDAQLLEPQAKAHSIEQELVRSLKERHSIASELVLHNDEAIVLTSFRTESEQWRVTINSEASSKDGSHRVVMVVLDGDFGIGVRDLEKARAIINEHNRRYWAGVFFVDAENDILGKWALNMPGVGMHPEMVADAVQRLSQSWLELLNEAEVGGIARVRHQERGTEQDPDKDLASLQGTSI